jgi:hypothetical protein
LDALAAAVEAEGATTGGMLMSAETLQALISDISSELPYFHNLGGEEESQQVIIATIKNIIFLQEIAYFADADKASILPIFLITFIAF